MTLSDTPAFTDIELGIIKHALGDKITASKIAGLHLDILSCPPNHNGEVVWAYCEPDVRTDLRPAHHKKERGP